jgi:hypothetical protein
VITTDHAPAPDLLPPPLTVPGRTVPGRTVPDLATVDPAFLEQIESAFADLRVGVQFDPGGHVYTYLAPPTAHVGSIVIVPANSFNPDPQTVDVVTLDPPPYGGPLARVLAVLT